MGAASKDHFCSDGESVSLQARCLKRLTSEGPMWDTFFALALATSVWFCVANLAVQLNKDQMAVNSVIDRRQQMPDALGRRLSAAEPDNGAQSSLQFD